VGPDIDSSSFADKTEVDLTTIATMPDDSSERESARRARLPDLTAVGLSEAEWEVSTQDADLVCVFDVEGRPAGPTDDDTYDAVEVAMRAEGRHEAADRFTAMRPDRSKGAPPRECFVDDPDPHRRGPLSGDFELRVRPRDGRLEALSLRALIVPGRASTGPWASLTRVDEGLHVSGAWSTVPEETFERLLTAADAVFGSVPRYEPVDPAPAQRCARRCRGGECTVCDAPIAGLGIRLVFEETPNVGELRFHLLCAKAEDVQSAIEFHRLGEDDLSEARVLDRGAIGRCQACNGIIRKATWRLEAVYFDGALHLQCALTHEPEGFRQALARNTEFPDGEQWRQKLS